MQSTALVVREVITVIVRDEFDTCPLGQGGRLIENKRLFLDAHSQRAHVLYSTGFEQTRQAFAPPDVAHRPAEARSLSGGVGAR